MEICYYSTRGRCWTASDAYVSHRFDFLIYHFPLPVSKWNQNRVSLILFIVINHNIAIVLLYKTRACALCTKNCYIFLLLFVFCDLKELTQLYLFSHLNWFIELIWCLGWPFCPRTQLSSIYAVTHFTRSLQEVFLMSVTINILCYSYFIH